MKKFKVLIALEIKGDPSDQETVKEDVYQYLQELMEEGDLEYEIQDDEEDENDEYEIY